MTSEHKFTPNNFKVSDFLSWQRAGTLDLNPKFQRRSVWKPGAKSYLIDTIHRGLPVPLIFLRERLDLASGETIREVVDGQQRLRTVLSFIDSLSIRDFEPARDSFVVSKIHNNQIGGKAFQELSDTSRSRLLSYQFSVQTLPDELTDGQILEVFARLNSTGQRLTAQELRNAAWFGAFKTAMYELSYRHSQDWMNWGVFNTEQMSRMTEVEMTSDLVYNMLKGLSGKSKTRLDRLYRDKNDHFPESKQVDARFSTVMAAIRDNYGDLILKSVFSREVHFFTLFVYTYDVMYGLGTPMGKGSAKPKALPSSYRIGLTEASRRFKELEVPPDVLDAAARASADFGRRMTRLNYLRLVVQQAG